MKHLTVGIYPSMDYKFNVVGEEDLESHIAYNKTFRPGRVFFVDGEMVCDGIRKKESLQKFFDKYKELVEGPLARIAENLQRESLTIPYR